MKKYILILFLLPLIGLAQNDCGKKPKKPNSTSSNYIQANKKYNSDLKTWKACIDGLTKTKIETVSKLGNKWIYDQVLYYEVIYDKDLSLEEGKIDISIKYNELMNSTLLNGATIKVQKKDGRTRVLAYDFTMNSSSMGYGTAIGGIGFGESYEQTYVFTNFVYNKRNHSFKRMTGFEKIENAILNAILNKSGVSEDILNEDW